MAADIKDWSANDLENLMLDDINLSREQGGEVAKLMGAIKRKFDNVDVAIAGVAGAYTFKGTVDTVADLPVSGNRVGDVYNVTSGTDGGNFAWDGAEWDKTGDSLVDVDGAQVLAKGSTTKRTLGERFADVINVKDFGAQGDGISDDTAAIQAALTAGAETGTAVVFPSGTYIFTRVSVRKGYGNLSIVGAGHVVLKSVLNDTSASDPVPAVMLRGDLQHGGWLDYNISADLAEGATSIPKNGNVALDTVVAGDLIELSSNQLVPGESRSSWTRGGVYLVRDVDAENIYLAAPLHSSFAAPSTTTVTCTAAFSDDADQFCYFGNLDCGHFDAMYEFFAASGSNYGAAVSHKHCTDWDNTTKLARFAANSAGTNENARKLWTNSIAPGDTFDIVKTLQIAVSHPLRVRICGDITITRDPVYNGESAYYAGLDLLDTVDAVVDGVTVENFVYYGICLQESWRPVVSGCTSRCINAATTGYGFVTRGSFQFQIRDSYAYGCRSGYSNGLARIQDVMGIVDNLTVRGSTSFRDNEGTVHALPFGQSFGDHGGGVANTFRNSMAYDVEIVGSCRGYKALYEDCHLYGTTSYFLYAQRFCGVRAVNCSMHASGAGDASFIRMHDSYDDTEPVDIRACRAEGLTNAFFYGESSLYTNVRLRDNVAVFSALEGTLTGVGGGSTSMQVGERCEFINNSVEYAGGTTQTRRGFFLPRFWCALAESVPIRVGATRWYVFLPSDGIAAIDLNDTSNPATEISINGGSGSSVHAVGVLDWDTDQSPLASYNKGSNVVFVASASNVVSGKLNVYGSGSIIYLNNKTSSDFYLFVHCRRLNGE